MGVFGVKGKLKGRPKERKQGVEKMERDWDDRGQLTLLMAFQFCVSPPRAGSFSQDTLETLCTAVHRCMWVCMCTCTRNPREILTDTRS